MTNHPTQPPNPTTNTGNVTERLRMAHMPARGDIVVDLFSGIGFFTLPLVVKASAAHAFACEWNPAAAEALRRNVQRNGVEGRVEVLEGDCREVAPQGVADRVCLGLLPSSATGWEAGLRALKPGGGWMHVHENVTVCWVGWGCGMGYAGGWLGALTHQWWALPCLPPSCFSVGYTAGCLYSLAAMQPVTMTPLGCHAASHYDPSWLPCSQSL